MEEGGWKQSALAVGGKVIFTEVVRIESASQQEALGYISERCNRSAVVSLNLLLLFQNSTRQKESCFPEGFMVLEGMAP